MHLSSQILSAQATQRVQTAEHCVITLEHTLIVVMDPARNDRHMF